MRQRRGIYIAKDSKSVGIGDNRYESDRPHLQASLIKTPAHLDITEMTGGTGWTTGASPGTTSETLLTIPHNLPYTPDVLVYFYSISYNGSTSDSRAGKYGLDRFIYSGGSGAVYDALFVEVDGTNLYIKHFLEDFFGGVGYTSGANLYRMRIKYYILSNQSGVNSYNTKGY
jgi:hypothetical protein